MDQTMTEGVRDRSSASLSELFEILSHEYRRYVLWVLADLDRRPDESVDTTRVLRCEGEPDILRIELVHNHLPQLDDYGFVDWDQETETLRRGPRFDEVKPFIDLMNENRDEIPQNWP